MDFLHIFMDYFGEFYTFLEFCVFPLYQSIKVDKKNFFSQFPFLRVDNS